MEAAIDEELEGKSAVLHAINAAVALWFTQAQLTSADGALTQLYLASADAATLENGAFYEPIAAVGAPQHPKAHDAELQARLWAESEAAVQAALAKLN